VQINAAYGWSVCDPEDALNEPTNTRTDPTAKSASVLGLQNSTCVPPDETAAIPLNTYCCAASKIFVKI